MAPPRIRRIRPASDLPRGRSDSLIGVRTECIREREARRRAPSNLCTQRPGLRKDPGLFVFQPTTACASAQAAIDGSHRRLRRPLFNKLRGTTSVLADGFALHLCGCSSAGRARPRHGQDMGSRPVIRSTSGVSVHSEATRHGVGGPGCARSLARSRAARHHVRRDARAWA